MKLWTNRLGWSVCLILAVVCAATPALAQGTTAGRTKLNVNTATAAELQTLPTVDAAMAAKIMAGRPYGSVSDMSKAGIPVSTLSAIRPLVTFGVAKSAKAPAAPAVEAKAPDAAAAKAAEGAVAKPAESATPATPPAAVKAPAKSSKSSKTGGTAMDKANRALERGGVAEARGDEAMAKSGQMPKREPPVKGMVWVNTASGIFYTEGDSRYGTTHEGTFMTEADAVKAGYRMAKTNMGKKK
ncbi:MAG TPA: helix-hairpin-helix domain-containing protein [Vicinamibacterales bacterium]|jgi:hypothetical protein